MSDTRTSGELFAGVGGLGMAVDEVFDTEPAWFCEFDAAPSKVLAYHYPDVPNFGDVTKLIDPPKVRVLAGGFPCQDVSLAGRRRGLKDGTRSGLWSEFARLIDTVRPDWVVIENVRGLLSADATGDMESCPWCVGDGGAEHHLRALGAVLGDLAELGFDAEWTSLRAADVGAPHGRFRVFILAWPAANTTGIGGREGRPESARTSRRSDDEFGGSPDLTLLPTPRTTDMNGPGAHGAGGPDLRTVIVEGLMPTPRASRGGSATETMYALGAVRVDDERPQGEVVLMPTPQVADGTGGHKSRSGARSNELLLPGVAELLHERKEAVDAAAEVGPGEELHRLRGATRPQTIRERTARGSQRVSASDALLAGVREHEGTGAGRNASVARPEVEGGGVHGMPNRRGSTRRAPHRPEPSEQRPVEPCDTVRELPSETALAGGPGVQQEGIEWGPYAAAIHRWEAVLGRSAPSPVTLDGRSGKARLNPALCEFMMGWPAGWVTAPEIGLTRAEQLKACGNGVVTLQAVAALRELTSRPGVPPITWAVAA